MKFITRYRETFPERNVGPRTVAAPSWTPKDYYLAYVTEAAASAPDLVVVGIFTR